jgi:hypothetical protein
VEELVALLSCLVWTEKGDIPVRLSEGLEGPFKALQEVARRIGKVRCTFAVLPIFVSLYIFFSTPFLPQSPLPGTLATFFPPVRIVWGEGLGGFVPSFPSFTSVYPYFDSVAFLPPVPSFHPSIHPSLPQMLSQRHSPSLPSLLHRYLHNVFFLPPISSLSWERRSEK